MSSRGGRSRGLLLVALASTLWSTIGVAARGGYAAGCSPLGLLLLRHLSSLAAALAGVLAGVYSLRGSLLNPGAARIALAVMTPFYVSYAYATYYLGVARSAALLYTAPAWAALLQRIRGLALTRGDAASALLVASGAALLAAGEGGRELSVTGLLWGLASGFTYALSIIAAHSVLEASRPLDLAAGVQSWLLAGVAVLALLDPPRVSTGCLPWAAYLGVVIGHVSYALFYQGLESVSPAAASSMAALELLLSIAWGVLLYGEPLTPWLAAGGGLIALGLLLAAALTR